PEPSNNIARPASPNTPHPPAPPAGPARGPGGRGGGTADAGVGAGLGDAGRAMLFDGSGNRVMLSKETPVKSVAFLEESRDALVAAEDGVFLSREVTADGPMERVSEVVSAGAVAGLSRGRLLIVDNELQSVLEVNLEDGGKRDAQCPCAPKVLTRMTGANIFRLNEVSNGPLWLVEVQESGLRTIFVPPDPSEPELEE
ncbi:MAG: hypothetical protein JNK48_04035, partial [Bryobacterales bacterium]|nr:hypothetical protein [Bryobacterales bacterium]